MKLTLFYTSLILIASLLATNTIEADEILRMQVKENKVPCTGAGSRECLVVKYKGSKGWVFFYSDIRDFDYREGFRYTLLVNRKKKENAPADAPTYTYELVKVINKRKKGSAQKDQPINAGSIDFLTKYKWKLIQMNGEMQDSSPVYMAFDKEKEQVSGISGCNQFFSSYRLEGNQIIFGKLGSTLIACPAELNQIEASFLSILRSEDLYFDIADQTLNVYQGNDLLLMFGRSPF